MTEPDCPHGYAVAELREINADFRGALAEAQAEIERLRAALWEVYTVLGFDTSDGIPTYPALAVLVVDAAREHRKDSDEGYDELHRENERLRNQVDRVRKVADHPDHARYATFYHQQGEGEFLDFLRDIRAALD